MYLKELSTKDLQPLVGATFEVLVAARFVLTLHFDRGHELCVQGCELGSPACEPGSWTIDDRGSSLDALGRHLESTVKEAWVSAEALTLVFSDGGRFVLHECPPYEIGSLKLGGTSPPDRIIL